MSQDPQEIARRFAEATKKKRGFSAGDIYDQRKPPQAIDLEEAVLGALMLDKNALSAVIDIIRPQTFYVDAHGIIFRAIQELFNDSQPIDILTVIEKLGKEELLDQVGGASFVSGLVDRVASAANIEFHARIISQKFIQRELIRVSQEIIQDSFADNEDVLELLDRAEKNLFEITDKNLRRGIEKMDSLITKAIKQIENARNHSEDLNGVPTGFRALDKLTNGWQESDLIILAGRPGMGKTSYALTLARNAAVDFDKPIAFFSLEMSAVQLVNRLISAEAEIDSEKLRSGKLADHEWTQLNHKVHALSDAQILIDDSPGINIFELRAKCRRLKEQHDIQMIMIDYLQLMSGTDNRRQGNREQEISRISRALKGIAKELSVPVIALSQLNRSVETRTSDKRPLLSDLRESGAIEQDADMVIFLYSPSYYGITTDENGNDISDITEVIIAKNRHGEVKTLNAKFIRRFVKFEDVPEEEQQVPLGGRMKTGDSGFIHIQSRASDDAPGTNPDFKE